MSPQLTASDNSKWIPYLVIVRLVALSMSQIELTLSVYYSRVYALNTLTVLNTFLNDREIWHNVCVYNVCDLAKLMLQHRPSLLNDYSLVLAVLNNAYQVVELFINWNASLIGI